MGDIVKGDTFVDGQSVNGARLNNLVDQAVIQPSLISDKSLVTPVAGDVALILQVSSGLLRKAPIAPAGGGAVGSVNSVGLALPGGIFSVSGSPVTSSGTLTGSLVSQSGNKVLASPANGSSGVPTFRVLGPRDVPSGSSAITSTVVDWSLAPTFTLSVVGNIALTFINNIAGLSIRIWANRPSGTFTVTWPATVLWPDLIVPAQTQNTLWDFTMIGPGIFGKGTKIS